MSDNKTIAKRVSEEVVFQNKSVDELMSPDFVYHPFTGGELNLEQTLQFWQGISAAFPDATITWNDVLAEGDKVMVFFTMQGTQQGNLFGIPPTNKFAAWKGFAVRRIRDGKVVEEWDVVDMYGLMKQLGVIP